MDSSGSNRYELLFMDDDVCDPLDNIVAKSKKQVKTATGTNAGGGSAPATKSSNKQQNADGHSAATKAQTNNRKPNQAEKENKPSIMNKNESNKKPATSGGATAGAVGANSGPSDKFNNRQSGGPNNANRKRNGPAGEGGQGQGQNQGARNVNFRQQNGAVANGANTETREQRNNRRNTREYGFQNATGSAAGDGSQPQPRQFRDRDNRAPPRQRYVDGGNRKREFDRQSGSDKTGVKSIDKRDGAGAHNWGSVKETIDDVNKNEVEGNSAAVAAAAEKADESGNEQTEQTPVEEETKELTLDEWKAQKQQRQKPTFNIRKAGEGEDTTQWKKMIVLNNNKKKETESEEELEFDPAMYPQRVGRQQRVLDIQFNFNDGRRGGGGFGGRGRGRGSRPGTGVSGSGPYNGNGGGGGAASAGTGGAPNAERGAMGGGGRGGRRNYGDRQQNAAPKVNDERQFPTLA